MKYFDRSRSVERRQHSGYNERAPGSKSTHAAFTSHKLTTTIESDGLHVCKKGVVDPGVEISVVLKSMHFYMFQGIIKKTYN
jgi:hypothetical protein